MNNDENIFSWALGPGTYQEINERDLQIDHSYQRPALRGATINKIAKNFRWDAFNCIVVMRRKDGGMFVIDGQQRLLGARKCGHKMLPCMVYESRGRDYEAEAFLSLNGNRVAVSPYYRYRAAVVVGMPTESAINSFLESIGLEVTDLPGPYRIGFCTTFIKLWLSNKAASKKAIQDQLAIACDEPLNGIVHSGLWYLCCQDKYKDDDIAKIRKNGGVIAMVQSINAVARELSSSRNNRIAAIGILRVINKARRNKIRLDEDRSDD